MGEVTKAKAVGSLLAAVATLLYYGNVCSSERPACMGDLRQWPACICACTHARTSRAVAGLHVCVHQHQHGRGRPAYMHVCVHQWLTYSAPFYMSRVRRAYVHTHAHY